MEVSTGMYFQATFQIHYLCSRSKKNECINQLIRKLCIRFAFVPLKWYNMHACKYNGWQSHICTQSQVQNM